MRNNCAAETLRYPNKRLRLHDCVVSVAEQLLAHGVCVVAVAERANAHMELVVDRIAASGNRIAALVQRANQHIGVFLMRNGGNLNHDRGG